LSDIVPFLPHLNASLNALATVLLVAGLLLIKRRQEQAHKWVMLACFGISTVFLVSYLTYHFNIVGGSKKFPSSEYPAAAYVYYPILISHILLAITVPFLAIGTIYLGLADKRKGHMRLAKWTFPIWLYVSVTGVVVYVMLYQIFQPHG
jgi:uncharacterized membrane protein YozB (DUF420 family)